MNPFDVGAKVAEIRVPRIRLALMSFVVAGLVACTLGVLLYLFP